MVFYLRPLLALQLPVEQIGTAVLRDVTPEFARQTFVAVDPPSCSDLDVCAYSVL